MTTQNMILFSFIYSCFRKCYSVNILWVFNRLIAGLISHENINLSKNILRQIIQIEYGYLRQNEKSTFEDLMLEIERLYFFIFTEYKPKPYKVMGSTNRIYWWGHFFTHILQY
jgi:hypothetical protein